jgi:putative oxidoreductase
MNQPKMTDWRAMLFATRASGWSILIRLLVGLVVFFPEGIQKLLFPDILGAGRFLRIGIPYPDIMGPFMGVVETVCGALIIVGLLARLAARSCHALASGAWHTKRAPICACCSARSTS